MSIRRLVSSLAIVLDEENDSTLINHRVQGSEWDLSFLPGYR